MFLNLRQGSTIYILDKSDKIPVLKTGQVVSVGNLTPTYNAQPNLMTGFQQKMEVSIRAKVDGVEGEFSHLPTDQSTYNYGNMVVTDSQEAMLSEVECVCREARQRLDNRESDEKTIDACGEMYKVLNPHYAKEKERDDELKSFSNRLDGIESSMEKILKLLNK